MNEKATDKGIMTIRVSDETRERLSALADSGGFKNRDEIISFLVSQHELQSARERVPALDAAAAAINELTDRINRILLGAGESLRVDIEKAEAEAGRRVAEVEGQLELLKDDLIDAEEKAEQERSSRVSLEMKLEEALADNKRLLETLEDKKALIADYQDKVIGLTRETTRLHAALEDAGASNRGLSEAQQVTAEQSAKIEQLERGQTEIAARKDLEKERALLELEKRLQAEYGEKMAVYENRIVAFMQGPAKTGRRGVKKQEEE